MLNRTPIILILPLVLLVYPATAMALTGGPDAGGYSFYDSDETGVDDFSWTDITSPDNPYTITEIPLKPNQMSGAIPIGFDFSFYGKIYSEVRVSSYGYLTFKSMPEGTSYSWSGTSPIPTPGGSADNFIAGLWGYLNTAT